MTVIDPFDPNQPDEEEIDLSVDPTSDPNFDFTGWTVGPEGEMIPPDSSDDDDDGPVPSHA